MGHRPTDIPLPKLLERTYFGVGCFWGPDGQFPGLHGVYRTRVGYAGGTKPNPTYRNMRVGTIPTFTFSLDHVEVIEVEFDPSQTTYAAMLTKFWAMHDCTLAIPKHQYISAIFYVDEEQKWAHTANLSPTQDFHKTSPKLVSVHNF